ncbi:flagellar basal-body rod protein FlgG [Roseateles sp. YR242]|uniref:flagellar basal-body rod protein FlgG n=1 Tax=Roseateles sp. YR242 TaxID=1855305 RepID=UPI0008BBD4D2|nr:flagellar basal-body rod protein FlgG [Roseateles sp. YR242]SEK93311.1 flagellar basal-body rod protein FlgG [Roseateles sp. YR242]
MLDSLYIGATGMHAQQMNVDTVANNLANVNTVGYKRARVNFVDLVVRDGAQRAAGADATSLTSLDDIQRAGMGVGVTGIAKVFDLGDIRKTDSMYDIAISGEGFFEVTLPDGTSAYTRGGSIKVGSDGLLATQSGHAFKPAIAVPDTAQSITIEQDGRVLARMPDQTALVELGQLDMVRFSNPAGLESRGDNEYRTTASSGEPIAGRAGVDQMGSVRQGYLEGSNVKLVDEMVNLMMAQRAYEASVKVVQASDEMLGMVNGLRRG